MAEKFATLEEHAAKHERERQPKFQLALERAVTEFEKSTRELSATIQDRSERLKVDRDAQRRVAELKRDAQRRSQQDAPERA